MNSFDRVSKLLYNTEAWLIDVDEGISSKSKKCNYQKKYKLKCGGKKEKNSQ